MRTFYLDQALSLGGQAIITDGDVHHIKNVLRMKEGDQLQIRNFSQKQYTGSITSISGQEIVVTLLDQTDLKQDQLRKIWLYLGIPRASVLRSLVRQITELGVYGLQLVQMERSEMKRNGIKRDRLKKISLEAMKQCLRLQAMKIPPTIHLKELIGEKTIFDQATNLLAYEGTEFEPSPSLNPLSSYPPITEEKINLWVGPERGISLYDKSLITSLGFKPISLAPHILRVDTAVLFLIAKVYNH